MAFLLTLIASLALVNVGRSRASRDVIHGGTRSSKTVPDKWRLVDLGWAKKKLLT